MIEGRADIVLGEAIRPASEAQRRIYGGGSVNIILCALVFAVISVAGSFGSVALYPAIGRLADFLPLVTFVIGGVAAIWLYARLHMSGFLKALRKIGSPGVVSSRFRFTEDEIAINTDRMSYRTPWSAVLLIAPTPAHWAIQVDTTTLAIPKRAFASPADEQAFIELAKACLGEDARARSVFDNQ